MNGDEPTESTALLQPHDVPPIVLHTRDIPQLANSLSHRELTLSPEVAVGYSLCSLFQLQRELRQQYAPSNIVWNHLDYAHQLESYTKQLDTLIHDKWKSFLQTFRNNSEIEAALWTAFTYNSTSVRVVDFLMTSSLVTDDAVCLSLLQTWTHGSSLSRRNRYDAACTPRVIHAIDLLAHLTFLVLLLSFILAPASEFHSRETVIFLLSISIVCRPSSCCRVSATLTIIAFVLSFPSLPQPGSPGFALLLLAAILMILNLISSTPPSPTYVLSPPRTLPLATLISRGISQVYMPVLGILLPPLLICSFALSVSMQNTFLRVMTTAVDPSPIETRSALLTAFTALLLLLPISFFLVATAAPSPLGSSWDLYSSAVGIEARRSFGRTVVAYNSTYAFPCPFNLISFLIVQMPVIILQVFGRRAPFTQTLQQWFWRVTVGPLALLLSFAL